LRGGEVIVLSSDLGGGKTTFAKGLAGGMGSTDSAGSPSFTISKIYKAKNLEIHHYDFYRLNEPGVITHELKESLEDPRVVTVVEWGDIVEGVLPDERIEIRFERVKDNEDKRLIQISCPKGCAELFKDLA
jgi:tRNA threonylcarbamoyladenosine biosynthesis protein TsaE